MKKPSKEQLEAAWNKTVPDLIAPGLRILFCGINPSLYSAAVGHHFARPGNRFWPTLAAAGLTDRLLHPSEEHLLLEQGLGITNIVDRATAAASDLAPEELTQGVAALERKLLAYRPHRLAVLGVGAYRTGFGVRDARLGRQPEDFGG